MALQQQMTQPSQLVGQLGQDYATQLTGLTSVPLDTSQFAPQVAGQDPLQTQAATLAGQGVGSYQPHLTQAGTYGTQAGTTMGGVSPYITGAAGLTGPGAGTGAGSISSYMSPYQSQVIDTSLAEFDRQAQMRQQGISDAAVKMGGYGGGREGVMQSEYQLGSDRNRAMLQAQMQQQGFTQANQLGNQAFGQQMQLGQAQQGLSQNQQGLAGLVPGLYGQDIGTLQAAGAGQQAQAQAQLDATREQNRLEAYEPYERLGYQGQGIASIASGAPGQYQSSVTPNPTPLQTALGTGAVLSGIYGNWKNPQGGSNFEGLF